jgi:two-component system nitrogen regulation response regulator NtrX
VSAAGRHRILIIDDEEGIRISLRGILEDEGHLVLEASDAETGLELLKKEAVDLVFLDIWLPDMDGLCVLDVLSARFPSVPVLMISGHGTIETAVSAIKKGAHDFIEKPLSLEKVLIAAMRALEFRDLKRENTALRARLDERGLNFPMGDSPAMRTLFDQMSRVAPLDTWVLISGENGTGKELVARALHQAGRRAHKPLVAMNCAAIPEELIESELFGHEKGAFTGADGLKTGKFEMADGGTLFLDEIGDMSLKTQARILRILQEKTFERVGGNQTLHTDVRVIAATNKDLEAAIASGSFREDLYYRLRVFPLHVPPLRARGEDIFLLADHFASVLSADLGLAPIRFARDARRIMLAYAWPGNVRELRNFIERMLILHAGEEIGGADLPPEFHSGKFISADSGEERKNSQPSDFKSARSIFEAEFLAEKFREYEGNISRLAEAVGLERSYLSRKLKVYGIQ